MGSEIDITISHIEFELNVSISVSLAEEGRADPKPIEGMVVVDNEKGCP